MEIQRFIEEEDGIGVIELILILVVLIGLVVIFRKQMTVLIGTIFQRITTDAGAV
ncbi:MAG: Flp1 family type IVb pilin [Lachnospiraceae bacterium]